MKEGILETLDVIKRATRQEEVNAIGYCVGGTLLAVTMAYMAKVGDERIKTATFFTTQVDFTFAGDLKVFVDEEQISNLEKRMAEHGYLDGSKMSSAFNMLRSNDLIWSYVVNNYLKGQDPFPFDLLYWNSDSHACPPQTTPSICAIAIWITNCPRERWRSQVNCSTFPRLKYLSSTWQRAKTISHRPSRSSWGLAVSVVL